VKGLLHGCIGVGIEINKIAGSGLALQGFGRGDYRLQLMGGGAGAAEQHAGQDEEIDQYSRARAASQGGDNVYFGDRAAKILEKASHLHFSADKGLAEVANGRRMEQGQAPDSFDFVGAAENIAGAPFAHQFAVPVQIFGVLPVRRDRVGMDSNGELDELAVIVENIAVVMRIGIKADEGKTLPAAFIRDQIVNLFLDLAHHAASKTARPDENGRPQGGHFFQLIE